MRSDDGDGFTQIARHDDILIVTRGYGDHSSGLT